ncbi:MAG: 6-carboxytetrahydropterin synthase QueD [Ruminobacter sp.]|jgi:6-pyruvoyltetrahydropterin/6-carboxytetrahydropterin synthase|nr:6-carboxytetrahydropterin synthase QueD [Ruminobacter sp.]
MYKIKKRLVVSAAHYLKLDYDSKCTSLHGHNWIIDVYLKSKELNNNGMIMDFSVIKEKIEKKLDHKILNDVIDVNPTAENIAYWICQQLAPFCYKVVVEESPNNIASYEVD